jgi:hypothetical protein
MKFSGGSIMQTNINIRYTPGWHRTTALLSGFVLLAGLLLAPLAGVRVARAEDTPDVEADEIPDIVSPGETLRYKFTVENWTDMELIETEIKLPYNTDILTPSGSQLNDEDDWISDISDGQVTITFGNIEEDDSRSASIEFEVNPNTPDSTELKVEAEYTWYSMNRSGSGTTDELEVLILNPNVQPQATITPEAGPPGTVYQITANRFWPYENVVTWLNTPTGVQELELHGQADNPGTIQLTFDSTGLTPGNYSLVLHGMDSGHERVVGFTVS